MLLEWYGAMATRACRAGFAWILIIALGLQALVAAATDSSVQACKENAGTPGYDSSRFCVLKTAMSLPIAQATELLQTEGWRVLNTAGSDHVIFRRNDNILKFIQSGTDRRENREGETEYAALHYLQAAWASANSHLVMAPSYQPFPTPMWFDSRAIGGFEVYILESTFIPGLPFDAAAASLRTIDEAVGLVRSVLKVLALLRNVGLLHRDIDARNVLVNGTDVYLIDFSHAAWAASPASTAVPRGLGIHRPPDWLTCGFDDFYSAGVMMRDTLFNATMHITLGIQQVIYHMTRQRCQDRVHDPYVLLGMLAQYGGVAEYRAPCHRSLSSQFSLSVDGDNCWRINGPSPYCVCGTATNLELLSSSVALGARGRHASSELVRGLTVLDIGGDAGFMGVNALLHGAKYVYIVESRLSAVNVGTRLVKDLNIAMAYGAEPVPADVVMASRTGLAWLSCHYSLGSVTEIVDMLARYTGRYLILEWLDYTTDAIMLGNVHVAADTARQLMRDMRSAFAGYRCGRHEDPASSHFIIVAAVRPEDAPALDALGMDKC